MLRGKRINLRLIRKNDLDEMFDLISEVKSRGDNFHLNLFSEPGQQKQFTETGFWSDELYRLLITDKKDRKIGSIQFWQPVSYFACFEIGYLLFSPKDWGKGYMTETVNLLVPYIFETHPIERIQAATLVDNIGSQKVIEKCGFSPEGTMRKVVFHRGQYEDLKMFSILRAESGPLSAQWQDE